MNWVGGVKKRDRSEIIPICSGRVLGVCSGKEDKQEEIMDRREKFGFVFIRFLILKMVIQKETMEVALMFFEF